jgi:hypothetical protein
VDYLIIKLCLDLIHFVFNLHLWYTKTLLHMFRNENVGTEDMKFYLVTECAEDAIFNEWRQCDFCFV